MLELAQRGFETSDVEWNDMSKGFRPDENTLHDDDEHFEQGHAATRSASETRPEQSWEARSRSSRAATFHTSLRRGRRILFFRS